MPWQKTKTDQISMYAALIFFHPPYLPQIAGRCGKVFAEVGYGLRTSGLGRKIRQNRVGCAIDGQNTPKVTEAILTKPSMSHRIDNLWDIADFGS